MSALIPFEIDVHALLRLQGSGAALTILDVREPWEAEICSIEGSRLVPMSTLPDRVSEVPSEGLVVLVCHHGARSARTTAWLRSRGFENAINLGGGIDAWARSIDPEMARY